MKSKFFIQRYKDQRKRNNYIRGKRRLLKNLKKRFDRYERKRFGYFRRRKFYPHLKKVVKPTNEKLDKELDDYFKKTDEKKDENKNVEMKEE